MASPVEEYLEAYDAAQHVAECYVDVADLGISQLMRTDPSRARAAIASGWPTAEQLQGLISASLNSESQLFQRWAKLPDKYRAGILKVPDTAGSVDVGEREFEEVQSAFLQAWNRR
jgi:hypothetical protein